MPRLHGYNLSHAVVSSIAAEPRDRLQRCPALSHVGDHHDMLGLYAQSARPLHRDLDSPFQNLRFERPSQIQSFANRFSSREKVVLSRQPALLTIAFFGAALC